MGRLMGVLVCVWVAYVSGQNTCPIVESDFKLTQIVNSQSQNMQMEFDKAGNIYWSDKNGGVWRYDVTGNSHSKIGTVPVSNSGYLGLLGFTLDPSFELNKHVYLLYNPSDSTYSPFRVSRFTLDNNNNLNNSSEKIILEIPNQNYGGGHYAGTPAGGHTGGKLTFGPGNLLYITTGDNCAWAEYGQLDERELTATALYTSGNTNSWLGKILRIKIEEDGSYKIPEGNLFPVGTAKTKPEIYSMGLRNPYSIHVDEKTNWIFVGESGPQGAANNPRGPAGGEEYTIVKESGFHGWPLFYGSNIPYARYNYAAGTVGELFDPLKPVNESKWNTGLNNLPPAQPAMIQTDKFVPDNSGLELGGNSGVGISGPMYRFDPDLNSLSKFPASFHRQWIIADYGKNKMSTTEVSQDGNTLLTKSSLFRTMNFSSIIDLKFGPDGSLYTLHYNGVLNKIEYTGSHTTPDQCGLVMGCTDPGYLEFNSKAEFDDGSCRTVSIAENLVSPVNTAINISQNGGFLSITALGKFRGNLLNVSGKKVYSFSGENTVRVSLDETHQRGILFVQIIQGHKVFIHKIIR